MHLSRRRLSYFRGIRVATFATQTTLPVKSHSPHVANTFHRLLPIPAESAPDHLQYTPLGPRPVGVGRSRPPDFRLLELLPSSPAQSSSSVQCLLTDSYFDSDEEYEAVSYCWGDPNDRRPISCNGKTVFISSSLMDAFLGLRYPDRRRKLWIDAICINQADPDEKASQVPLMRTIYSRAQRTLVWLGRPSGKLTEDGISLVAKIHLAAGLALLRSVAGSRPYPSLAVRNIQSGEYHLQHPFSSSFYLALLSILRRPWFQRAWVVQEVAVSRRASILWDGIEYDWQEFVDLLKFMTTVQFPLAFVVSLRHIVAIDHERTRHWRGGRGDADIFGVLVRHQRCLATDPRDKVYAFAGLVVDKSKLQLRVSYTDGIQSVYKDLAAALLRSHSDLDILSRPPSPIKSNLSGLPSWVPDWSISTGMSMGYTWTFGPLSLAGAESRILDSQTSRFSAAAGSKYSPPPALTTELPVEGYVLDTISEAGPVFEGIVLPERFNTLTLIGRGWASTLRSFLKARTVMILWQEMVLPPSQRGRKVWRAFLAKLNRKKRQSDSIPHPARSQTYSVTGESLRQAFWETVCAGEYVSSPQVAKSAALWDRLSRSRFSRLRPSGFPVWLDPVGLPYALFLLVWHFAARKSSSLAGV
ncbi:HET-domain-containing protein [Zalerion maritima]|uniref:HET-domain-containing protein n=1 Tax=Zalerion maritima TaxID=339359 RepID=A0AAD5RHF3_9PEZI|nr:HET-domain-containing protein [Zalerion maritima]